ncbi:MAG: hydroxyacid dehydrogenase [Candidatus Pacebacteria bacterium]|nr:hydroxyacid dehydrogenase [Candidatus Paceibacterota bacterium]
MKIAFFEIKGWEKKYLNQALKGHKLSFYSEPLQVKHLKELKSTEVVSVFIYSKVKAEILKNLPKLKMVATRSTGFDHIDLKTAKKQGVKVCNVPSYGENTVAEHTFALILALSRNIHKSYIRTLHNDFSLEGLKGFDLKGKTLGVIGAGKIGMHTMRIARSFGMKVIAFDVNRDNFMSDVLDFDYVSLDEVFKNSDIISLHAPYNEHTKHIINRDSIKKMKKGVILINTARGGLIDLDALMEGLDKDIIGGAGLDVIEGEEYIKEEKQLLYDPEKAELALTLAKDHILFDNEKVIFTPHIAFYSQEALMRILEQTVENISNCLEGKQNNLVT